MRAFGGIDRSAEPPVLAGVRASAAPLSVETIKRAIEEIARIEARPRPELHHPLCPKLASDGRLACRCWAMPLEAIFEDEIRRVNP